MPDQKKVTIKDVARETGLALSTVSNALAGKSMVRPETRAIVMEAADRLGYRASIVARSLRAQRSFALGVLIEDVANPSSSAFVRGVEDVANAAGCTILLADTDGSLERQVDAMRALIDRRVDGLVLISQHLEDERVREMLRGGPPVVLLQRRDPVLDLDYVGSDNVGGVKEAMHFVGRLGHSRVGFVTGPLGSSSARERLQTYRETAEELGFRETEELIYHGRYSFDVGLEAANFFAGLREPPTCIFASNDMNAIGLIQGLSERGLSVPKDISVVGLDDIALARIKALDLTTIRLEKRAMGEEAARLVLRRVAAPQRPTACVILPTRLIVRGTTAQPRAD
ncbi:LacI family DNA-binding transcriptional regulator [Aurantimonas sp. VKM B-3413]|uniref:LacI family DNA-binding transcriptional regulator n=1 Tax=Aurantimonas sp. VKM B-3413 TaxID=2779401 RepID=UPI001E2DEBB9|nr:LacI family DNA-binding transcriptional regulator [Aurantimonas sp. VKM B-3413]MCB8838066.1 LacI family transcriptional regulator [Aurantimonas sp. VKM B-3413]